MSIDLHALRRREVQAIGAAISCRDWHGVEQAYNRIRDALDNAGFTVSSSGSSVSASTIPTSVSGAGEREDARKAAYDRLERHLDEHYYAGARDDLRDVAALSPALDNTAAVEARKRCSASPDHADILETIGNADDAWQAKGYTSALAEVRDMANVGRALMEALPEGYSYMNCPSEIVSDLQNEIADLSPALDNTAVEGQDDGAGWIVGNNAGQWRTFDSFGWAWTDRRDLAVRYARRADAELVHGEDEDSWRVERYSAALTAETEEGQSWRDDDCRARSDLHDDPVEQLAFELAYELEEAALDATDYVTVNRAKLRTIAERIVARAALTAETENARD